MRFNNYKWKRKEQGLFLLHIGQLLEQGYPLGKAIELVGLHQRKDIQEKVKEIVSLLREGTPVYEILLYDRFPKNVAGFLFFAEQHGNIAFAFKESGKLMVKLGELIKEFFKLIRYPIFLCLITFIVFFFIHRRLIPQFQSLYQSLELELPLITKIFLILIKFAPTTIFSFIILSIIVSYIFLKIVKRYSPLEKIKLYLKIPLVKTTLPIFNTQYFAIQLSYLLKGGLSIYECLSLFEKQAYFKYFQLAATEIKASLKEGHSFPDLLKNHPLFTPEFSVVVSHGLANGQLSKDLSEYCSFLVVASEEKLKFYFSIIQPVLFSIIGVIIFVMFISILLPMFNLLNSL